MAVNKTAFYNPRHCFRLSFFASLLAFFVIVLGAYTRLTDAGLGCPDWPGCYGHLIVPNAIPPELGPSHSIHAAKAWTEMIHRYMAGLLGITIFALAILAIRNRRFPEQPLLLPLTLGILVFLQALLGMWTVTLKLFPLVVMAHLLGGLTTLSLLWWLTLKLKPLEDPTIGIKKIGNLRLWAVIGLIIVIIQLFLGGWTSANYAALVCTDFPFCQSNVSIPLNFSKAFDVASAGVVGSIGTPLDNTARVTIHMLHRIGALFTTLVIGWLAFLVFSRARSILIRALAVTMASLLTIQILLGITNVLERLPLPIAIAHNAIAALLLLALVTLNYYLHSKPRHKQYGQ